MSCHTDDAFIQDFDKICFLRKIWGFFQNFCPKTSVFLFFRHLQIYFMGKLFGMYPSVQRAEQLSQVTVWYRTWRLMLASLQSILYFSASLFVFLSYSTSYSSNPIANYFSTITMIIDITQKLKHVVVIHRTTFYDKSLYYLCLKVSISD